MSMSGSGTRSFGAAQTAPVSKPGPGCHGGGCTSYWGAVW
jgi:hypothetical protein